MTQSTNTHELIEALERQDERASVKIMVKDYADGWYELKVSRRPNVEQLRQALAIQPQAEAQPGVREPTEEMLIAGNAVMDEYANEQIDRRWEVRDVFKAMLKAAPAQPASAVRERVVQIIMRSFSSMPSTPTWQDREKATYEIADAILTALEPAPAQAGPRELHAVAGATYAPVYAALYPALVEITRKHGYALAVHGSLARDFDLICVPWISRPSPAELVIQDVVDAFAFDAIGSPETKEHGRLVQTLAYVGECFLDLSFIPALTATPAQPTPSGEVDRLVAEIDALFERATPTPWVADLHVGEPGSDEDDRVHVIGAYGNYAKQCLVRELSTMQGNSTDRQHADAQLIAKLVTAWPRLRTALGGGWRDDMENAPRGTPVLLKSGLTDRLFIGFNMGDGWIERGSRHVDRPPTHWMPLPPPPQLEGET